jgi:hypothetical protein
VTCVTELKPSDCFSETKSIISMSPTRGAYGSRMRTRKVRSWLLIDQAARLWTSSAPWVLPVIAALGGPGKR